MESAIRRVVGSTQAVDLADAQLVIEAVFEDAEVKSSVLRATQAAAPRAVLATNTAYLGVGRLTERLDEERADRTAFLQPGSGDAAGRRSSPAKRPPRRRRSRPVSSMPWALAPRPIRRTRRKRPPTPMPHRRKMIRTM